MSVNKNNRYISFKIGLLRLHKLHLHAKYHETSTLKSARDDWGKLLFFLSVKHSFVLPLHCILRMLLL